MLFTLSTVFGITIPVTLTNTQAETIITDDSYTSQASATTNYGTSDEANIRSQSPSKGIRAYFGFNLSKQNLTISSLSTAKMNLYQFINSNTIAGITVEYYFCKDLFNEITITWNNQDTEVTNCDVSPFYTHALNSGDGWKTYNLTSKIKSNNANVFTVKIKTNSESYDATARITGYRTTEYATNTLRPRLNVVYMKEINNITSIKTQLGTLSNNSYFNSSTLRFNITTDKPTQKKYFLYNYSTTTYSSYLEQQTTKSYSLSNIVGSEFRGNTFKPNLNSNTFYNISNIVLSMYKIGSPTGTVSIIFKEWTGTTFTGSNICSTTFASSGISVSQTEYNYSLSGCNNFNTSKTYGFYLSCASGCDGSNYIKLYGLNFDVYPRGVWIYSLDGGSTWASSTNDNYFILNIRNAKVNGYNLKTSALMSPVGSNALSSFSNITLTNSLNNLWKIYFNATNVNGTTTSSNYTFTFDTTVPVVDFSKIQSTYNTPAPPKLNITIIDANPNTCKYKLDATAYASCTNSTYNSFTPSSLTIGTHILYINATDKAGNKVISNKSFIYEPRRIVITFKNVLNNNTLTQVYFRDRNFSTNYYTGSNTSLTLYHNAGTYYYNYSKPGYKKSGIESYTISAIDVVTYKTIYLSPTFNITLYDEVSLAKFNLTGTSSVYLRITCANESVQQYLITKNNIGVNISCFYTEFKFVVNYPSTSYYRSILLDVQQTNFNVYLMNLLTTQSLFNSFRAFDLIGEYVNPKLVFSKSVSGSVNQITGDFVDASGNVPAYLVLGDKYQLTLYSDNQPTKDLGFYTAATAGSVSLVLFQVAFKPNYFNKDYSILHQEYISLVGTTPVLVAQYNDTGTNTNSVALEVRRSNEFGAIIYTASTTNDVHTWLVNLTPFNITGNVYVKVTASTGYQTAPLYYVKTLRVASGTIDLGLPAFTYINLNWVVTLVLSFITLIFTFRTASMGSVVLIGVAALCITFGWLQLSWAFFTLALILMIVGLWFGVKEGA